jgi:hypothetical protein
MVAVRSDDPELTDVFEESVRVALDALDFGSFLPRLVDASSELEPRLCQSCEVKEACLRGDSGARARLERWLDASRKPDRAAPSAAEDAALRLFNLGVES